MAMGGLGFEMSKMICIIKMNFGPGKLLTD